MPPAEDGLVEGRGAAAVYLDEVADQLAGRDIIVMTPDIAGFAPAARQMLETGDFLRIAQSAGASVGNLEMAWWGQTPLELAPGRRAWRGHHGFPCPR